MKTNDALIRYPVPIGTRTAYLELPRNLSKSDVKRLYRVMLKLCKVTP